MATADMRFGDCIEIMKSIPSASVDMVLCDLPYGTTKNEWDKRVDLVDLWSEYRRIVKKNGAILLFAQCPYDKIVGASNLKMLRYEYVWDKALASNFLNSHKMPLKRTENILVFYRKMPTYNPQFYKGGKYTPKKIVSSGKSDNWGDFTREIGKVYESHDGTRYPTNLLQYKGVSHKNIMHRTQKPVELCEHFILTYTNTGDIVLDNCAGSGTTGIACINHGRNFILIEKDVDIYGKMRERIVTHIASRGMFAEQYEILAAADAGKGD